MHAGEIRALDLPAFGSCSGVTVHDELGAFDWLCDDSAATPRAVSTSLKAGKYLSDLIDWTDPAPAFRPNRVVATDGSTVVTSAASVWWDNPLLIDNDGGNLGTARTLYLVTEDGAANYAYSNSKVGLVVRPGVTLSGNGTGGAVVSSNNNYFVWFEGSLTATGKQYGLSLGGERYSVVRRASATGANSAGMSITSSYNVFVDDIVVSDNLAEGLVASGGDHRIRGVVADNNGSNGIRMWGSGVNPSGMRLIGAQVSNSGVHLGGPSLSTRQTYVKDLTIDAGPLTLEKLSNGRFLDVTIANYAGGAAINGDGAASIGNIFHRVTVVSSGSASSYAVEIPSNSIVVQLSQHDSPNGGLVTDSGMAALGLVTSTNVGNRGMFLGGNVTLMAGLNRISGDPDSSSPQGIYFDQIAPIARNIATTSDVGQGIGLASPADGMLLTGLLRVDGSNECWLSSDAEGAPFDNTCTIVSGTGTVAFGPSDTGLLGAPEFRLAETDTLLREIVSYPTGDDVIVHRFSASSSSCGSIPGASWAGTLCTLAFLQDSFELFDDEVGNDNGLCESNETCVFMPNIGVYQGHGELIPGATIGSGGTIQNVTLLRYETNGE